MRDEAATHSTRQPGRRGAGRVVVALCVVLASWISHAGAADDDPRVWVLSFEIDFEMMRDVVLGATCTTFPPVS